MSEADITTLLSRWSQGDRAALDDLTPLVYDELRKLARSHMSGEKPGHTLQSTALAHEAYLRLIGQDRVSWQSRAHFYGIASQMVRRILVDHARAQSAAKRGSGLQAVTLNENLDAAVGANVELLALEEALSKLAQLDPQQARIVELRYFGGLSIEETAEVVGVSPATVKREWVSARAWLYRALSL